MLGNKRKSRQISFAEDDKNTVGTLFRLRLPSLVVGLLLGLFLSFVTSKFEMVLAQNVKLAFFIPFIVYLADAVGTQTQNIYTRSLKSGKASFKIYLVKESFLGIIIGLLFGLLTTLIVIVWLKSFSLATVVGLGTFASTASAPLVALVITELMQLEKEDPAVWAGPIATVAQDTISVLIYGIVASALLL